MAEDWQKPWRLANRLNQAEAVAGAAAGKRKPPVARMHLVE